MAAREAMGLVAEAIFQAFTDDDGPDPIEAFDAVLPSLSTEEAQELALALELCPEHHCDYRICLDDKVGSCAHWHER